ncbi:MAG: hypothetical protein BWY70_01596 [Bacteroidetes bacterium ADurb.Bin408]|nr:MAG: hypothetical protein BWY70_01596 [Bacteroidetes bacterium ADurb.Bin408]
MSLIKRGSVIPYIFNRIRLVAVMPAPQILKLYIKKIGIGVLGLILIHGIKIKNRPCGIALGNIPHLKTIGASFGILALQRIRYGCLGVI